MNRLVTARCNDGGAMAVEAEAEGDPYMATLERLSQFSKGSKAKTKMNVHKTEWLSEWQRLESQRKKLGSNKVPLRLVK